MLIYEHISNEGTLVRLQVEVLNSHYCMRKSCTAD